MTQSLRGIFSETSYRKFIHISDARKIVLISGTLQNLDNARVQQHVCRKGWG